MNNYSTKQFTLGGSSYVILDIKQIYSRHDALLLRDDGVAVIGHGFTGDRWDQGSYFMNGLKSAAKRFYNLTEKEEENE